MENFTSIEKIDAVLETFIHFENDNYTTSMFGFVDLQSKMNISLADTSMILNKLIIDGFIKKIVPENPESVSDIKYQLTFEGKLFIEQGCYGRKIKIENKGMFIEKVLGYTVAVGGSVVALFYLLEILRHYIMPLFGCH